MSCSDDGEIIIEPDPLFRQKYSGEVIVGLYGEVRGRQSSVWLDLRGPKTEVFLKDFQLQESSCLETELTVLSEDEVSIDIKVEVDFSPDNGEEDISEFYYTFDLEHLDGPKNSRKGVFVFYDPDPDIDFEHYSECYFSTVGCGE